MNRQFLWVLCGILLIHVVAITAFKKSSDERRREISRSDLPSAEEMGTSPSDLIPNQKSAEELEAKKREYHERLSVSEDVFTEFGEDPTTPDEEPVEEIASALEPTYTPNSAALPEPAPLSDVPDTEISRLEAELAPEIVENAEPIVVPAPLERPEIEPAPTRKEVEIAETTVLGSKGDTPEKMVVGIDREKLKPVSIRPLTVTKPVLASGTAAGPTPTPIPVADIPTANSRRDALKPITLPTDRVSVSPAPPVLRAKPIEASATVPVKTATKVNGKIDRSSLPSVNRIRR